VMSQSMDLWKTFGPPVGNPDSDPPPSWIKFTTNNVGWRWDKINAAYWPGNYFPWVQEGFQYALIVIGPLMLILGLIMLVNSYRTNREINQRSTYSDWSSISSTGVCCTVFMLGAGYRE
jgi:hypothetical protein